jgi:hypothetical protein
MDPVTGLSVSDRADLFEMSRPGAFSIKEGGRQIWCECPCGCGGFMNLSIHQEGQTPVEGRPSWVWNGDYEHPTLQPSIRDMAGCYFHGHLTQGVWTFEGDSGVKQG